MRPCRRGAECFDIHARIDIERNPVVAAGKIDVARVIDGDSRALLGPFVADPQREMNAGWLGNQSRVDGCLCAFRCSAKTSELPEAVRVSLSIVSSVPAFIAANR